MQREKTFRVFGISVVALALPLLLLAVSGCEKDGPMATANADVTLSQAKITVADQSLDGQTMHQGEQVGTVHYEAHLIDCHGQPAPGYQVRVRVKLPGMMNTMHHMTEEFLCYDDGTHGDPIPGDGVYCYDDTSEEYGCHRTDAQPGDYRYDFCGIDGDGHESNHMNLMVRLLP